MLFNEIYSLYYKTVAKAIDCAINGDLNDKTLRRIISENAFSESEMTIFPAIKDEKWQVICADGTTPIKNTPFLPLTTLEKRWLKAISLDKRIQLFDVKFDLEDVQPLFCPEDVVYFDRYSDGDDFENSGYIKIFRTIVKAIKDDNHPLDIEYRNTKGRSVRMRVVPQRLEYSPKDDKFRLVFSGSAYGYVLNVGRMISCDYYYGNQLWHMEDMPAKKRCFVMEVSNERNALERVMLHFAHFEKQAEQLGDDRYSLTVWYDTEDETELIIRILSFGPMVKVVSPADLVERIKQRLKKQMRYL